MSVEQLEDIYQETLLALYRRPYASAEHLRSALRDGIKKRALRLHRDEQRHSEILESTAPSMRLIAEAQEGQRAPEPAAIAQEDRLIAREFLTELNVQERRVFGWLVEGLQYRAIATVLDIPVNEARNAARACDRKRERFQLLYDTGRLCGYRAQTIQALQHGQNTTEELAERAFAHLENCAHCRLEHKTNAKRLRASFRDQAAALLPPILIGRLGWLTRLGIRSRLLAHRVGIDRTPLGQGGVRERAVTLLAGGGASAKIAAGVITIAVLTGGAVASHVLEPAPPAKHHQHQATETPPAAPVLSGLLDRPLGTSVHRNVHEAAGQHRQRASVRDARKSPRGHPEAQREPGGFAYLGVPSSTTTTAQAHVAASSEGQRAGGPFSP